MVNPIANDLRRDVASLDERTRRSEVNPSADQLQDLWEDQMFAEDQVESVSMADIEREDFKRKATDLLRLIISNQGRGHGS